MNKDQNGSVNVSGGVVGVVSTGDNARIQINAGHIGGITGADETLKEKLEQLVKQLNESLEKAPPENRADAEAVAQLTEDLVRKANQTPPNPTLLRITAQGMKEAAAALVSVVPPAIRIVNDIAALVLGIPR